MIYPDFASIFPGEALIPFLAKKVQEFRNFVLHNWILNFDAEQVYPKLQVTNVKNKEVTAKPKSQILKRSLFFLSKILNLNPKY